MHRKPNSGKKGNLSQYGLLDIPGLDDGDDEPMDMSDDDFDLEAELAAISGGAKRQRPRKPAPVPSTDLDAMIAASLKDVPSDEEDSGDEDDPDLLSELRDLGIHDEEAPPPREPRSAPAPPAALSNESSTISLLQNRISHYTLAKKNAEQSGESGRARRFDRGLKTLNDLLKQAKAGKPISDDDIPPPVGGGQPAPPSAPPAAPPSAPAPPVRRAPAPPEPSLIDLGPPEEPPSQPEPSYPPPPRPVEEQLSPEKQHGLQVILQRQAEFKMAALASKRSGDKNMAIEYMKVVKQFDIVVQGFKQGEEFDFADLPTPESFAAAFKTQKTEENTQGATAIEPPPAPPAEESALITASTVDEALKQRLAYFQQQEVKCKEEGNASKARRMGRIVKQYKDAARVHARGGAIVAAELPAPPGYAPLPVGPASPPAAAPSPSPARAAGAPSPAPTPSPSPSPSQRSGRGSSRYDKQLAFLLQRQKQFKEAALKAKKNGDIEQAKEYLRAAKGFDSVIEAARGGLLVDLKSLPLPPGDKARLDHTFDVVSAEECAPPPGEQGEQEEGDVAGRLHKQLRGQLQLCRATRDHYRSMGNVAEANRFDHLADRVNQDLDVVLVAKSLGHTPPKFHYESRQFSIVQCNTDLNENVLELTIVRGIAYNVDNPDDVETYVKYEFPYPQEAPVSRCTGAARGRSPQYAAAVPLGVRRAARGCLRVFKRHAVKLEVYSRGGWFSRDALLGTVVVKLAPLEGQVTLHDSYPLMDGRRPAGGSLEVKLRVRTPLLHQQIENTTHRWLVIDN